MTRPVETIRIFFGSVSPQKTQKRPKNILRKKEVRSQKSEVRMELRRKTEFRRQKPEWNPSESILASVF